MPNATVTDVDGTVTKGVTVQVIGELLRVLHRGSIVIERHGVDRLDRGSRKQWTVVMGDGTSLLVDVGGCNCRGR